MVNGAVCLIASYNFFCKQTIVLRNKPTTIAMSNVREYLAQIVLCGSLDYTAAHWIKHAHNFYFIIFVSSELGICGRYNSLVCNDRLNSQWRLIHSGDFGTYCERVECSLTYLNFASFNAPYVWKKTASIQFLILRLIIRCALWSQKYGNSRPDNFGLHKCGLL